MNVRALAEGDQLITLRKGGIRERNKHFEVAYDRFFLYPTFDHQHTDLVRESHLPELKRALDDGTWPGGTPGHAMTADSDMPQPRSVRIRAWADLAGTYRIDNSKALDRLSGYHVWSPNYATKRLNWKPSHPLWILLLRVHRIPRPVSIKVKDGYGGCRSWVDLERDIPFEGTAVLSDAEFARVKREIESITLESADASN